MMSGLYVGSEKEVISSIRIIIVQAMDTDNVYTYSSIILCMHKYVRGTLNEIKDINMNKAYYVRIKLINGLEMVSLNSSN